MASDLRPRLWEDWTRCFDFTPGLCCDPRMTRARSWATQTGTSRQFLLRRIRLRCARFLLCTEKLFWFVSSVGSVVQFHVYGSQMESDRRRKTASFPAGDAARLGPCHARSRGSHGPGVKAEPRTARPAGPCFLSEKLCYVFSTADSYFSVSARPGHGTQIRDQAFFFVCPRRCLG